MQLQLFQKGFIIEEQRYLQTDTFDTMLRTIVWEGVHLHKSIIKPEPIFAFLWKQHSLRI